MTPLWISLAVVGAVCLLGTAAVAVVAVYAMISGDPNDGDRESQSGCPAQPRVDDTAAGLCYAVPDGWASSNGDLIEPLTSSIGTAEGSSTAIAGRWEGLFDAPPSEGEMADAALSLAAQYAEFFFPMPGERSELESHDLTIDGRSAGTGSFRLDFRDDEPPVYVRTTTVQVGETNVSFVFSATEIEDAQLRRDTDRIHDSIGLTGSG